MPSTARRDMRPWEHRLQPNLKRIESWAMNGATNKEIAARLHISMSTLTRYAKKHKELDTALTRGKEVVDDEVQNALLKRALGYKHNEITQERHGDAMRVSKVIQKEIPPDVGACVVWLANRRPAQWKARRSDDSENTEALEKLDGVLSAVNKDLMQAAPGAKTDKADTKTEPAEVAKTDKADAQAKPNKKKAVSKK